MKALLLSLLLVLYFSSIQASVLPSQTDSLLQRLHNSPADSNRVKLLLELSYYYVCRSGEKTDYLNKALLLASQANSLSQALHFYEGEGNSCLMLSKVFRKKGDLQQAKVFARRALDIFSRYGQVAMIGQVYLEMARYYPNTPTKLSTKISLNEQALTYFVQAGDKRKEADILKEQGDLYQLQENYQQSLRELQRALMLYRSLNHQEIHGVYDLLGFVSTKTGDYKSGLDYGLKAVTVAQQRGDTGLALCTIYNRLGITYQALGRTEQAHAYFKKSLAIAQQYNHIPSIVYLSANISTILLTLGQAQQAIDFLQKTKDNYPTTDSESRIILATRFMDIYCNLKQYTQALPYYYQVLALAQKHGAGSPGMAATYQSVIGFLLASRQYEQARKYLAINQALCQRQGAAGALAANHLQFFKLDSTIGNYPTAITHYQRYVAIRDSLLTESKNHQIAKLEVEYQTEKKDQALLLNEKNIQLLNERSKLQQNKLEQAQLIRNSTIAGAFMLIFLLGLSYNRYRLKRKSNQLLQSKQAEINHKNTSLEQVLKEKNHLLDEKEWMLKEIHHRVRNNLQIITSLLHSQAGYLSDNTALSTIKESQHRVQAMALIHQKLYQSEQMTRVDMASYINDFVVYLRDSYEPFQPINFNLSVEPLELDVTLAVPLGLIINEAITNSLKYAFPENRSGTININLQLIAERRYQLTIADNGVGFPAGFNPSQSRSLGMTLIHGLSEQLGGKMSITTPPGVTIKLEFQDEPLSSTYTSADYTYRWHRPFKKD